jgi:hypothetical protein
MDSPLTLLKEEINKTQEAEHDLAKWKLGVTAALGSLAFGLTKDSNPNYWLLLFIPFVCAYIDLYAYQYQSRIAVIARFLRENPSDDPLLQTYEMACQEWRRQGIFSLGRRAGFGCSIAATILSPAFYFIRNWDYLSVHPRTGMHTAAAIVWLSGFLLIIFLWRQAREQIANISNPGKKQPDAPAVA